MIDFHNNKNVLVTGGSGFIGSAIVDELFLNGYTPIVVDKKIQSWSLKSGAQCIVSAIQDLSPTLDGITDHLYGIIHLAAYHVVSDSVIAPHKFVHNNMDSLMSAIDIGQIFKVNKFVFSSSAAVYGKSKPASKVIDPCHPYGLTKVWGEQLLKYSNLNHISLRYFNASGAGYNHGYIQQPMTHVIPIIMNCLRTDKEFTIFGDKYNTKDGSCVRDYTHVKDIAIAHVNALKYTGNFDIMNIGSGVGTSVFELIKRAEIIANKKLNYRITECRSFDPDYLVVDDSEDIKKELGWKTKFDIDNIITDAWAWENR